MSQKQIAHGAEAKIFLKNNLITKDRIKKSYRLQELDNKIIKSRTKAETKLLTKASQIIHCPTPQDSKEFNKIKMPFIDGKKLSEHLDNFPPTKQKQICRKIGQNISKLHNAEIIHGDLTTSNMIMVEDKTNNFKKLITKLKKLNLPHKDYAVFGSAPLAIRGLRDSRDLDLIVIKKIFEKYKKKSGWKMVEFNRDGRQIKMLEKDEIELSPTWGPGKWNPKEIINNAEIIEGIPFANLKDFIKWKKISGREKDKKDIQLIKNYSINKKSQRGALTKSGSEQFMREQGKPIIFFIDFGLGFISNKFEDKAVDLHLLKQALEAKHFKNWEILFKEIIKSYDKTKDSKIILERLKAVEKRGRYKVK